MINLGRRLGRVVFRLTAGLGLLALLVAAVMYLLVPEPPSSFRADSADSSARADRQAVTDAPAPEGATMPGLRGGSGPFMVGEEPQPPHTLGDDARLDALWALCAEGSGSSCDRLFAEAPVGSEYERFGVSCGERPHVLNCRVELDGGGSIVDAAVPGNTR